MTIADDALSVRQSRGVFRPQEPHIALARAASATARAHGAVADCAGAHEVQVAIAGWPDAVDVDFWRPVLEYAPLADDDAVDQLGHGSTVWMQELDADNPPQHALHIDQGCLAEVLDRYRLRTGRGILLAGVQQPTVQRHAFSSWVWLKPTGPQQRSRAIPRGLPPAPAGAASAVFALASADRDHWLVACLR